MVLRIHRGGGFVISGTDTPLDNIAISLHANLRSMVAGGFTPYEALTTATRNPAKWLNLEDRIGVIKPGAQADLSFVDGDPLADIRVAAGGRSRDGRWPASHGRRSARAVRRWHPVEPALLRADAPKARPENRPMPTTTRSGGTSPSGSTECAARADDPLRCCQKVVVSSCAWPVSAAR